jgi:hypothetical protein
MAQVAGVPPEQSGGEEPLSNADYDGAPLRTASGSTGLRISNFQEKSCCRLGCTTLPTGAGSS